MTEDYLSLTCALALSVIIGYLYPTLRHHLLRAFHLAATLTLTVITLLVLEQTILHYTTPYELVANLMVTGFMAYLVTQLFKHY